MGNGLDNAHNNAFGNGKIPVLVGFQVWAVR
jgi:hypothetical protein